ncbi:uncharacterized protein LOC142588584 [Dermacentor variabilis]|uniref:uncharacterized protein LOC142588584 n=1 Tax=Dermacentor variabilis TaxID=34621 RepID=UPI003F5BF51A
MLRICIKQIFCLCLLMEAFSARDDAEYSNGNEVFTYQDPKMMLQNSGRLLLFRTSKSWTSNLVLCFRSSFIDKNSTTYWRTAEFYAPTKVNKKWVMKFINLTLQITPEVTGHHQSQIIVQGVTSTERRHTSGSSTPIE